MKKIGIIGSRRRNSIQDYAEIKNHFLNTLSPKGDTIISGGCPKGGDRFAEILAKTYSIPITIYKANWKKYGKSAGFIRNTDIAKESDILIACVAPDRTGGTENTIKKFKKFHPDGKIYLC